MILSTMTTKKSSIKFSVSFFRMLCYCVSILGGLDEVLTRSNRIRKIASVYSLWH